MRPILQQNIPNLLYLKETELMERMVSNYDFVYSSVLNRIRLAEKKCFEYSFKFIRKKFELLEGNAYKCRNSFCSRIKS